MKKTAAPALILIFLILAVGIFVVFRVSRSDAPDMNHPGAATATPEPTATAVPTAMPEPTATPVPTAAPSYEQTGSFHSNTGANINLIVKWSVTGSGNALTLKLDAYVESYALVTGDRSSDVVFNVGGSVTYASSKAIRLENVGLTESYLGSTSVEISSGTDIPVNVTWYFNGTYSNQSISTIVAEDTIHIN